MSPLRFGLLAVGTLALACARSAPNAATASASASASASAAVPASASASASAAVPASASASAAVPASASASGTAPAARSAGALGASISDCPWNPGATSHGIHDVAFCSCTHRFVGPLSGCHAEHRIYTANGGGGHYTTDLDAFVAYADVDGDGVDEALFALRERDLAPTDQNAREHTELTVVRIDHGALSVVASAGAGRVDAVSARPPAFVVRERGAKGACDVGWAVRGATLARTSPECP